MYEQLPEAIRQEVQAHLEDNNFPAAKRLYDQWTLDTKHAKTANSKASALKPMKNVQKNEIDA